MTKGAYTLGSLKKPIPRIENITTGTGILTPRKPKTTARALITALIKYPTSTMRTACGSMAYMRTKQNNANRYSVMLKKRRLS